MVGFVVIALIVVVIIVVSKGYDGLSASLFWRWKKRKKAAVVNIERIRDEARALDTRTVGLWLEYENDLTFVLKFPEAFRTDSPLNRQAQKVLTELDALRQGTTPEEVRQYRDSGKDLLQQMQDILKQTRHIKHSLLTPFQAQKLRQMQTEPELGWEDGEWLRTQLQLPVTPRRQLGP